MVQDYQREGGRGEASDGGQRGGSSSQVHALAPAGRDHHRALAHHAQVTVRAP